MRYSYAMKVILSSVVALAVGMGAGWFLRGESAPRATEEVASTKTERVSSPTDTQPQPTGEAMPSSSPESVSSYIAGVKVAPENLESLGEQFKKTSNPLERNKIFNQLLSLMTADNALTIRDLIKDLRYDSPEFRNFHYAWGALAGKEAIEFGLESREYDGGILFQGWASASPDAAREWYTNMDFQNDPAFEHMRERGRTEERIKEYLQEELVKGLYAADPREAAQYLSTLEGENAAFARRSSEELVEDIISRNGIEAAKDWVELLPTEDYTSGAIGEIADEWSEKDSGAALEWAMTHENDAVRQSALENVWRNIAQGQGGADPFTAAEEISAMAPSPDKDYALAGFASGSRREYPETAVEAALSISDPGLRDRALVSSASSYLRSNPTEANEWLQNSGISQDLVEQIQRNSRRR